MEVAYQKVQAQYDQGVHRQLQYQKKTRSVISANNGSPSFARKPDQLVPLSSSHFVISKEIIICVSSSAGSKIQKDSSRSILPQRSPSKITSS
mmetsp:Transcript_8967/g.13790  ORF Transcript_8967/g.13790 Transcript_8967/m.13790 type:complete len:93 (+) Transcript_8967:2972-3250(+)